jgi:hypothetical protein
VGRSDGPAVHAGRGPAAGDRIRPGQLSGSSHDPGRKPSRSATIVQVDEVAADQAATQHGEPGAVRATPPDLPGRPAGLDGLSCGEHAVLTGGD